jgi:hypothetical protein
MVEIRLRAERIIMDFEAVRFHIPAVIVATDRQLAAEWSGEGLVWFFNPNNHSTP